MIALGPSHLDRPPHGLWSLWEMLELKAGAFVDVTTHLSSLVSWIEATSHSAGLAAPEAIAFHKDRQLGAADRIYLQGKLESLRDHLSTIGGEVTLIAVDELIERVAPDWVTWGYVKDRLEEINNTLRREISTKTLIVLDARERAYFAPKDPHFGKAVAAKFTSVAEFEIDEAAKCLALGRPTAAVFHLMRVMEVGIYATASCLGVPDPVKPSERNWGKILDKVWEGIEKRWPSPANRMSGDGALFEGVHASLDAVKNPWRNGTMHVENKYTEDEAQHIFSAVRGFMMKLASRCDENGDPKA